MRQRPALRRERARELRRQQTDAEAALWDILRNRRFDAFKFRRQHPVGPYFLDFYSAMARLGVELDGGGHCDPHQVAYDKRRDAYLCRRGIHVLRYPNDVLFSEREAVLADIWCYLPSHRHQSRDPHPHPVLLPQAGEGTQAVSTVPSLKLST